MISNVNSQDITGTWNGKLTVQGGISLRLVFNIEKTDEGYKATMDSPDQGAKGIPMSSAVLENNVLTLEMSAAGIKYVTTEISKDSIVGTFSQMGQKFPLNLYREVKEPEKLVRPQEPLPPYPYNAVDIIFPNEKENIKLAGTITYPAKKGKYPAVVLITGSGPENRDEKIFGHKPFLVIADYLTRNGIIVLRFDDRGTFKSEGIFKTATSFDFATDVEAAIKYLKTRDDVDPKKIGLIGHSEGGIIAPIVAVEDKSVNFIILLAGTAVDGGEISISQQELIGKANGMKDEDIAKTIAINKEVFRMIRENNDTDSLKKQITEFLLSKSDEFPKGSIPEDTPVEKVIEMQVAQITGPWMLNFIRYNPAPTLSKVKCATLALFGEKDLQVSPALNIPVMKQMIEKSKNKKFEIQKIKGVNHMFQECKTGLPGEYVTIEQTFSPEVLKLISDWILKTTKFTPNP